MLHRRVHYLWCALLIACCTTSSAEDLSQGLNHTYVGKVFLIRNFWQGTTLNFDAAGQITGQAAIGFWTTDGFIEIRKIKLEKNELRLECKRLMVLSSSNGLNYHDSPRRIHKREIVVSFGGEPPTIELIGAALAKVFVSNQADFFTSLPDYWRKCFDNTGNPANGVLSKCRLAPRILDVLGTPGEPTSSASGSNGEPKMTAAGAGNSVIAAVKVGGGVSAPKPIYLPDPEFSEEARAAGFQGVCVLGVEVDRAGNPQQIRIVRPLGYGLDEKAVEAVSHWKFNPAQKDGEPVAVIINIEVQFRMR